MLLYGNKVMLDLIYHFSDTNAILTNPHDVMKNRKKTIATSTFPNAVRHLGRSVSNGVNLIYETELGRIKYA